MEDWGNIWELAFSFHYVGPRHRTQVIRLGGKWLYPLNYPTNPYVGLLSGGEFDVFAVYWEKSSVEAEIKGDEKTGLQEPAFVGSCRHDTNFILTTTGNKIIVQEYYLVWITLLLVNLTACRNASRYFLSIPSVFQMSVVWVWICACRETVSWICLSLRLSLCMLVWFCLRVSVSVVWSVSLCVCVIVSVSSKGLCSVFIEQHRKQHVEEWKR